MNGVYPEFSGAPTSRSDVQVGNGHLFALRLWPGRIFTDSHPAAGNGVTRWGGSGWVYRHDKRARGA